MNQQVYDFLNSARVMHWQLLRLKSKHDELESCLLPAGIRYDKDRVQTSPDDTISKIVAEINGLERRISELQIKRAQRIEKIYDVLRDLPQDEWRTALTMRFINRKPVTEIADQMGYAEPTIYKFMNQGAEYIAKNKRV